MFIYFFAKIKNEKPDPLSSNQILKTIKEIGTTTISNIEDDSTYNLARELSKKEDTVHEPIIKKIDAFIIESSTQDPQVSYLIAQAALHQKPTLCLFQRKLGRHNTLSDLANQPNLDFLKIKAYSPKNTEKIILKFLREVHQIKYRDNLPTIKFTLRISKEIENYLAWQSKNEKTNKAVYLRDKILNDLKKDKDYQRFLEKHL